MYVNVKFILPRTHFGGAGLCITRCYSKISSHRGTSPGFSCSSERPTLVGQQLLSPAPTLSSGAGSAQESPPKSTPPTPTTCFACSFQESLITHLPWYRTEIFKDIFLPGLKGLERTQVGWMLPLVSLTPGTQSRPLSTLLAFLAPIPTPPPRGSPREHAPKDCPGEEPGALGFRSPMRPVTTDCPGSMLGSGLLPNWPRIGFSASLEDFFLLPSQSP